MKHRPASCPALQSAGGWRRFALSVGALCLSAICTSRTSAQTAPVETSFAVRDRNTPRTFPGISSKEGWEEHAREIREQIMVSCGLWPMPPKTPLNAHVFGKIERDGYCVEKIYIETMPGFYLAGNLYRPLGRGAGPFPAILNPHGHWPNGRLQDSADASIPGRCINFARQGMIAFSYDLVGYNDTRFADSPTNASFSDIHHSFATQPANQLWNISLMGLQTWNSIRAVDFIASLPDADPNRLACTGESGGGTQTFMLGAVDDRLAAQAPVVMISHTMQGGCLCENAPGLRVKYSNMEIAAAVAPRPQIDVSASGDWTKDTLTVEGPAIQHIYDLFNASNRFSFVRFNFGHNYNQTSREAVYEWFGKWLLENANPASLREKSFVKEPDADLRVFPDGRPPEGALTQAQLVELLKELHQRQWRSLVPHDEAGLQKFSETMLPAWRHTLQIEWPRRGVDGKSEVSGEAGGFGFTRLTLHRSDESSGIRASYWAARDTLTRDKPTLVVLVNGKSPPQSIGPATEPDGLPLQLLRHGVSVLRVDQFTTADATDQFENFFTTYNCTKVQERVADIVAICDSASVADPRKLVQFRKIVVGSGAAGLWALLAAPAADAVIADCDRLDVANDDTLLAQDLFCPGLRNIGTFEGAAMLAAPHPLMLHNLAANFPLEDVRAAYAAVRADGQLRVERKQLSDEEIVDWIARLK